MTGESRESRKETFPTYTHIHTLSLLITCVLYEENGPSPDTTAPYLPRNYVNQNINEVFKLARGTEEDHLNIPARTAILKRISRNPLLLGSS